MNTDKSILRSTNPKLKWFTHVNTGLIPALGIAILIENRMPFVMIVVGCQTFTIGPHR
jgi:hypothetical protein